jgi:hypothetical protein
MAMPRKGKTDNLKTEVNMEEKTAEQEMQQKEQNVMYMRKYRGQQLDDEKLREIQQRDRVQHQVQRAKRYAEVQKVNNKRKFCTIEHAASNAERTQAKRVRHTIQQQTDHRHITLEQRLQILQSDKLKYQEERKQTKQEQMFEHAQRPTTVANVKDAEHDPKQALWKFYGNSGMEYFGAILPVSMTTEVERNNLHQLWHNNLEKEIVTTATVDRCINNYNKKMWLRAGSGDDSLTMQLQGCAACGIGDFNMDNSNDNSTFKRVSLQSLRALQVPAEQYALWKQDPYKTYRTIHVANEQIAFYLHSEFVTVDGANLCSSCHIAIDHKQQDNTVKLGTIPRFSVASGCDWGKGFPVRPLSFLEMCVIAPNRLYMYQIKLVAPRNVPVEATNVALLGHTISFRHNAPEVLCNPRSLPRLIVSDMISILFVGTEIAWNHFRLNPSRHALFQFDFEVVRQWLIFLQAVNVQLRHLDVNYIQGLQAEPFEQNLFKHLLSAENASFNNSEIVRTLEERNNSDAAFTRPAHHQALHSFQSEKVKT